MIAAIGDVCISGGVEGESRRMGKRCARGGPAVARETGGAIARNAIDYAIGTHTAYPMAGEFGYVEHSRGIHRHVARCEQSLRTRDGCNHPARTDLSHAVVSKVRYI